MNSPMLSSKLAFLQTKMCGKMMAITTYFKDELQLLKKESSEKANDLSEITLTIINQQWYHRI